MAVDPKFANVPWIAVGEPDFYESGDLAESDQRKEEDESELVVPIEIEKTSLSTVEAHKRFAKCKVDNSFMDFSDPITALGQIGYAVETEEYDVLPPGDRHKESLIQRFQRLQTEVKQLQDDVQLVSQEVHHDSPEPLYADKMTKLAALLTDQLANLQLENLVGANADFNLGHEGTILQKSILEQISQFKLRKKMCQNEQTDHITYEIYSVPSQETENNSERLAVLDRRLQQLEGLLGQPDPSRLSALTSDVMGHGLLEAAARLAARSALLQPKHLDHIETRLSALQSKLQQITERREVIADADTQHKIANLYEIVKKWQSVSTDLPEIVDRMTALQYLHEQASEFCTSIKTLELEQKKIDENLSDFGGLLKKVDENMQNTMNTFKESVVALEGRLGKG